MLLAFALLVPAFVQQAQAGCGHYVILLSQQERLAAHTDLEVVSDLDLAALEAMPPLAPLRELPCSGPTCSRNPVRPEAPAPPTPVRTDSWCCTGTILILSASELVDAILDPLPGRPVHLCSGLERPPRSPRSILS
jgi:hypothetical protein